nr:unnamed protein product [Callosobruchus analis]
MLKEFQIV